MPYICNLIVAIPSGWLSDKLISSGKLSKLSSRKLFSAVGNYGPALGMVALSFVGCNRTLAIVALCGSVGMDAASFSGFMVNRH